MNKLEYLLSKDTKCMLWLLWMMHMAQCSLNKPSGLTETDLISSEKILKRIQYWWQWTNFKYCSNELKKCLDKLTDVFMHKTPNIAPMSARKDVLKSSSNSPACCPKTLWLTALVMWNTSLSSSSSQCGSTYNKFHAYM